MTLTEKRMTGIKLKDVELAAFDPVVLENIGGQFVLRKADPLKEHPHAILNSDATIRDGHIFVPSWWHKALMTRYEQEHNHA